jgi:hypothetical protein
MTAKLHKFFTTTLEYTFVFSNSAHRPFKTLAILRRRMLMEAIFFMHFLANPNTQ